MASFLLIVSSSQPLAVSCASSISSFLAANPISIKPMKAKICARPAAGMVSKAAKPAGTDLNGIPNAISPGSLYPAVVTRWPRIVC